MEFTVVAKEVKLMAIHKDIRIHQYLDDWLVKAKSHQVCLQHTQDLVKMCQQMGWLVNLDKSELEPKQVFNFRLPVWPQVLSGSTYTGQVAKPSRENTETAIPTSLSGPGIHALDRFINSHRKASSPKSNAQETHTVASQKQLEGTRITRKVIPIPRSLHPHLQWWLKEDNVLTGQPLHPIKHALQIFTDASKEGWGAHLNEHIAWGTWSLPESKLHIII